MTTSFTRIGQGMALALLLALVCGCAGGLLPKPPAPPARFTLDGETATPLPPVAGAMTTRPDAASTGTRTLLVAPPTAAPGFDSLRMVYLRSPQVLEAFAFHEWADTPARMLAPLLVRALQRGGAFAVVVQAPSAATGTWRLETEVIRLQHDFTARPSQVRLTLRAVLVDTLTRQPLAWREFDERVPAAADTPAGGAAAAHAATQRVLAAVAVFVAEQATAPSIARPVCCSAPTPAAGVPRLTALSTARVPSLDQPPRTSP